MGLIIAFVVVCGIGIGSSFFLGPDNPIEEEMEDIAEDMIEVVIQLPDEPPMHGFIDFSPSTPEKKRAYIDNS